MNWLSRVRTRHWSTLLLGLMVLTFTIALVVYPKDSVEAGLSGLKMFWDIVFPSLLPFFVLSELLLGLGLVRGLGVLLEPLMRPLFSVPGIGAFALSMGLAAGYPMDAVITARFREQGLCTRIEGERLLAFTNTADPLFMFGAVAVGMFKSPALGALLAIAHYISAFLVGILFKFWGKRSESREDVSPTAQQRIKVPGSIFIRAYRESMKAREEDGRPFGKLLGNAVSESVQTLLMICGFIMFFAVIIQILHVSGLIAIFAWPVALIYHLIGVNPSLVHPTLAGLLEIDIGSAQTAAVNVAPLVQKFALVSGIIAWSGLSVHAQVASVLTQTDIRMAPYFLARLLHAVLAAVLTVFLYGMGIGRGAVTTFAHVLPTMSAFRMAESGAPWWNVVWTALSTWGWVFAALFAISVVIYIVRKVRVFGFHARLPKA